MNRTKFTLFCCFLLPIKALAISWTPSNNVGSSGTKIYAYDLAMNSSDHVFIVAVNNLSDTLIIEASSDLDAFQTISTTETKNFEPYVGISSTGAGVAVWRRLGTNQMARSATYSGTAWADPTTISVPGNDVSNLDLAMNGSGDAFAVWEQYDGSANQVIKAAHYTSGAWSAPITISSTSQFSGLPKVAINENGNAIAVWLALSGNVNVVQSATFTLGAWSSPPQTLSQSGADSDFPNVAINLSGNGVAVWQYFDGQYNVIQAANYLSGAWSSLQTLSLSVSNADIPQVAMNDSGNAVAAWVQDDSSNSIQAATYFAGAWDAFETISTSGQDVTNPKVAMNNSNDAIVLCQSKQSGSYFAQAIFFTSATWQTPQNLSSASSKEINPLLGFNNLGHAYAAWTLFDGTQFTIQSSFGS